jgi:DNA-3-methyladenine glycosylase
LKLEAFFARSADVVARELIGALFTVDGVGGEIVETEAYGPGDPASHSFRGKTARNASMFGPSGHAYVYRIYGLHWCFNMVAERGSAVLIRVLAPTERVDAMMTRRHTAELKQLCAGPGRLCQALAIDRRHDGLSLGGNPFLLRLPARRSAVVTGVRIGVREEMPAALRFCKAGSPYLSRKVPPG